MERELTETKEQRAEALNSLSTLCDFFQNRVLKGPSDEALREFNRATKEWVSVTYKELGEKVKRIWRRFDYSSIYLLIGGTFSPILLIDFYRYHPTLSIIWFCLMWAIIITGITMVAIFGPGRLKWLHFPLYFIIGWSALMLVPGWIKYNINFFWFILAGGLVYTFGMIPFVMRGKKAAHFIWHLFVLFGAITHFLGIYFCLF